MTDTKGSMDQAYRRFTVVQIACAVALLALTGDALWHGERMRLAVQLVLLSGFATIWFCGRALRARDSREAARAAVDLAHAEAQRDVMHKVLADVAAGRAMLELHRGVTLDPRRVN